ncbi:DUF3800 domain-containing protein [Flavobacterium sp. P4023]|uniref:DUF3800 domain-containing protein n=1 Tax=Flavobacterium flabelliforme TaxID=2816119 RepID=A0ABS5CX52_9FLAO|nr:DUF3800 domain-containing protein [Flavobacterium flabelliforme]MBP4143202.1 DUF3800 domain-containing protein [Flavobacterium flabelliforme]
MKHLFTIDETGSPGNISESITLKNDRKTYVAVFIKSEIRENIICDINSIISNYSSSKNPINELHFTDLLNRRKEYKSLDTETVLSIIKDVTDCFNKYSLPFFLQTVTPRTLEENGLLNKKNKSLDEIALDFLFQRIKNFIEENNLKDNFEIIIDQGLNKPGHKTEIPTLKELSKDNFMLFQSSSENPLIQVADFFAFTMNRNQMMLIKEDRTDFDILLLTLLNSVLNGNETSGSKPILIKEKEFSKDNYDKHQIEIFKEKGIYDYWKKVNK